MSTFFTVGQIIVSKVFVGHSMPLKVGDTCDRSSHHTLCSVYRNMDAKNKTTPSDGMKEINLRKKSIRFYCSSPQQITSVFSFRKSFLQHNDHLWVQLQTEAVAHVWSGTSPAWVYCIFSLHNWGKQCRKYTELQHNCVQKKPCVHLITTRFHSLIDYN